MNWTCRRKEGKPVSYISYLALDFSAMFTPLRFNLVEVKGFNVWQRPQ
jgi:hypothetical protein